MVPVDGAGDDPARPGRRDAAQRSARPARSAGGAAGAALRARPARLPVRLQRRYGDIFTVSFPFFGRLVYVADPALVKAVFTGSPAQFHAGEANATVLEPALGPNSVLTLDDAPHMRQRKLLLPPFHGERIRGYGELIREIDPAGDGELAGRRALRAAPPHPADHPGGDHARRLRRPRRGAPDPLRGPDRRLQPAGQRWSPPSRSCAATSAAGAPGRASCAPARRSTSSSTRRSPCAAPRSKPARRATTTCSRCCSQARHDDGSPMSDEELRDELVTVLGAGHETTATGLAWAMERLLRTPRCSRACATRSPPARTTTSTRRQRDAAGAAGDRRRRPQADRAGRDRRLRAAERHLRAGGDRRPALPRGPLPRSRRSSGPSASSRARPTTTPGSPSAAACGAASAPPSPNTRCGSSCARSSSAPSSAPPTRSRRRSRSATSPSPRARARVVRLDRPLR